VLTRTGIRTRRGISIIEVIVAMVVAGVVLAIVTAISVRQQRLFTDLVDAVALSGQLREAASILPIDLQAVSVTSRDIREARDTSIELRATIASAVVCDTNSNGFVLAPVAAGATTYASYLTAIDAGDTVWVFTPTDSVDEWRPFSISGVSTSSPRQCATRGPRLADSARAISRVSIGLSAPPPSLGAAIGTPMRVTRPVRYSLYRAGDGLWYVGEKDWSTSMARFNTIQPVSGPFLSAAAGGLTFTYLDSAGLPLVTPVVDPTAIAAIRVRLRGQTRNVSRVLGSGASTGRRVDTSTVVLLLHNRR
jgi:Tfp pilus assembly protein PilW